ncbi:helix-turn-helix domain-containing protein [Actinophytocola sediminis]
MGQARQTFERRQLGLTLRRLRDEAGKSQQQAAETLGKARTRIGELEDGRFTVTADELADLLDLYGVSGKERQIALDLGTLARTRQKKRRAYTDLLPGSFQRFADLESSATEINAYEVGLVPGLLQSLGYVRATIDSGDGVWWTASHHEREERIRFRFDRQASVLGSDTKRIRFVLTEDALRGGVGSPDVMREQRRHILEMLESNPNLAVRVLPSRVYGNPARGNGFTVFGFGDKGPPVGFCSVLFGPSTYLHQESDTTALLRGFQRLMELALDQKASAQLIRRIDKEN